MENTKQKPLSRIAATQVSNPFLHQLTSERIAHRMAHIVHRLRSINHAPLHHTVNGPQPVRNRGGGISENNTVYDRRRPFGSKHALHLHSRTEALPESAGSRITGYFPGSQPFQSDIGN